MAFSAIPVRAQDAPPPAALAYRRSVIRAAHLYWGFGSPLAVMFGQIHQESRWRSNARSSYAAGLAQFTPETAADMERLYPKELRDACRVRDCRFDPEWAIRSLVLYDHQLWSRFEGEPEERTAFALAAYNGGEGWLRREQDFCAEDDCDPDVYFGSVENACGRSRPARSRAACKENRDYPAVILHRWAPIYGPWCRPEQ